MTYLSSDWFRKGPLAVQLGWSQASMWIAPWSDVMSLRSRVKCEGWSDIAEPPWPSRSLVCVSLEYLRRERLGHWTSEHSVLLF